MTRENFKGNSHNACFAVFDGHGGQRAAEFARLHLANMLEQHNEVETNVMVSVKQGKLAQFERCPRESWLRDRFVSQFCLEWWERARE